MTVVFPISAFPSGSLCLQYLLAEGVTQTEGQASGVLSGLTRIARIESAQNVLSKEIAPVLEKQDWASLLSLLQDANNKLAGAYQLSFYDGQPYLTYVEAGDSHFALKNKSGAWVLVHGPHPIEALIQREGLRPEIMQKRFKVPYGMFFVGLETSIFGFIIPIFSTSSKLQFFRNLGSGEPREVKNIPLVFIKINGFVDGSDANLVELPKELQDILLNGKTLTTIHSTHYTHSLFFDATPTAYSALMVADDYQLGRTGVVLKNELPLITRKDGQEYFLEIKGVGIAQVLPANLKIVQARGPEGNVRSGRIKMNYVQNELVGSRLTQTKMQVQPQVRKLYARSMVGVSLPEHDSFFNYEGRKLTSWEEVRADAQAGELSAQVYRLSTSTRRMAFTDNPAFGRRYTSMSEMLNSLRWHYGKLLGDLMIRESEASMHDSPHAENFASYPVFKTLAHTDYADINVGYNAVSATSEFIGYGIFSGKGGTENTTEFYQGLRASLEPRGLWTEKLDQFSRQMRTADEFVAFLNQEFIIPFSLKEAMAAAKTPLSHPLPRFDRVNLHFLEDAKSNRRYLQIQVDFLIKDLAEAITTLQKGIFLSTVGRSYFAPLHSRLDPLMTELQKLRQEVNDYAKGGKEENWQRGFDFYYQETLSFLQRQALLYDQVNQVFGLPMTNIKDFTSTISK